MSQKISKASRKSGPKSGKAFANNKGLAKGLKRLRAHQDAHKAAKAADKGQKSTPKAAKPSVAGKATGNGFENPYRVGSSYHALTSILAKQIGKYVDCEAIIKAFPAAMGDGFKAFKDRDGRNDNAKDCNGRITQNLDVLRRVKDYGKPIAAQGYAVLKKWEGDKQSFGLIKQ